MQRRHGPALRCGVQSTEYQAAHGYGLDAQRAEAEAEGARRGYAVEWTADEGASDSQSTPAPRRTQPPQLRPGRAQRQGWNLSVCDLAADLSTPQGEAMANMPATSRSSSGG